MKRMKKEGGVSEVLGSILVLLITVTLFSSVFYYVSTMPTPKQNIYAQFDAHLELVNVSGNTYANITVKNVGGESLTDWKTMFIVVIDAVAKQHMLSWINLSRQSFDKDNKFSQGESFYYNSSWDGLPAWKVSDISVALFDKSNSKMIWSARLQGRSNLPPMVIGITSSPAPIVIGKYGSIKAIVFDPDEHDDISKDEVGIDLSSLNESSYVKMSYAGKNLFTTSMILFHDHTLDPRKSYRVVVYIKDSYGRNVSYPEYLYISIGTEVKGPDLFVDPNLVVLSDSAPTHMSDVTVSVTVQNRGGTGAIFKLEVYDIYRTYPGGQYIQTNVGDPMPLNGTYSVSAAGQTTISFIWEKVGTNESGKSSGPVSGNHQFSVEVIDIKDVNGNSGEDPNAQFPNKAVIEITVLPKILFVDADHAIEGTPNDVSKYYRYILDTCDYDYTTKRTMESTVLTYDGIFRNYDLVVWETGYYGDSSSPDTSAIPNDKNHDQMDQLATFYDHGGSLWIISPETYSSYLQDFGIGAASSTYNGTIKGVKNNDINLTLPNGTLVSDLLVNDRTSTPNKVSDIVYVNSGANDLIQGGNLNIGVYKENNKGGKLVYLGFEFSRIMHYYNQNFIGYRILQWLGNLSGRVGTDVAVDDMEVLPEHPLYMQNVTISVVVSNNGGSDISTKVMLKIDDVMTPDIRTENPNDTGVIPANGGFVMVSFTWRPTLPGRHVLTVYADPYNALKETNEQNNILNGGVVDNIVYVEFSTLLIYNDTSKDENLTEVQQAFHDLGYAYQELNVHDSTKLPTNYEDGTFFTRYNLVIWVSTNNASASTDNNAIGSRDAHAIVNSLSLTNTIGFMFIGSNMPEILEDAIYDNTGDNLLNDYFGVIIDDSQSLPAGQYVAFGINNENSITNGLSYVITSGSGDHDVDYLTGTNAIAMGLFRDPLSISTDGLQLEEKYIERSKDIPASGYGIATVSSMDSKVLILPLDFENLKGMFGLKYTFKPVEPARQSRAEMIFHASQWFGQLELRPELAVYEPEIDIESEIPQIMVGHSYMLRVTVHNYGLVGVSTVIRFYDDYEWIGSKSVYVSGANESVVEIVWTPMFAGQARHIRVVVDPLNKIGEIENSSMGYELFNYNNEAIKTVTVWYFWDNMEHGDQNWMHEATIAYISGESPLDFLDRKDVSTNVVGSWDTSNSFGWYWTNDSKVTSYTHGASHTTPSAFWMPEVESEQTVKRTPIDLVMMLDDSGSMSDGNKWNDLVDAVKTIILEYMTDQDRLRMITYHSDGSNNGKNYWPTSGGMAYMTGDENSGNKSDAISWLESIDPDGGTPLWDYIGQAISDANTYHKSGRIMAIMALTDGDDTTSSDYGPWTEWNGNSFAIRDGSNHEYRARFLVNQSSGGNSENYFSSDKEYSVWDVGTRDGILSSPYRIYTIGLGLVAHNKHYNNEQGDYNNSANWTEQIYEGHYKDGNSEFDVPHSGDTDSDGFLTTEFDLWNVAWTSNGKYFFSPTGDQLKQIFEQIYHEISVINGTGGVRAMNEEQGVKDSPAGNYLIYSDNMERDDAWGAYSHIFLNKGWYGEGKYYDGGYYTSYGWTTHSDGAGDSYSIEYHADSSHKTGHLWSPRIMVEKMTHIDVSFYASASVSSGATVQLEVINVSNPNDVLYSHTWDLTDSWQQFTTGDISVSGNRTHFVVLKFIVNVPGSGDEAYIDNVDVTGYYDPTIQPHGGVKTAEGVGTSSKTVAKEIKDNYDIPYEKYRFLITPSLDLKDAKGVNLTFWTKYWDTEGTNGGVMYLWVYNTTANKWTWDHKTRVYLSPKQSYTGNLMFSGVDKDASLLKDKNGNLPYWCFNGRSTYGTFGWDYIEVPLTQYLNYIKNHDGEFRIVFLFAQYGGLTASTGWHPEMGWYLDDVKVKVTSDTSRDIWQLHDFGGTGNKKAHSGRYAWEYNVSDSSNLPTGVDSSLITKQIDLTTARTVNLEFWLRFNINNHAGLPPATIRVEVSSDNGATWDSITYGVRIGWNASGTDTQQHNGKSYSGIPDDYAKNGSHYGWVNSMTLMRINCNLNGWAGSTIMLRFRVATNATNSPTYQDENDPYGVFLDDTFIYGESYAQEIPTRYIWT